MSPTHPETPPPTSATLLAARTTARSADATAGVKNLQQLIQLRWTAVIGQVLTIEMAHYSLGLVLPVREMLLVVACLALFNVVSLLRLRMGRPVRNVELFLALLIDVAVLTVQLYLSGGTSNPFVFLYLLQITLGAVLLRGAYIWTIVAITVACFAALAEYHLPLALPQDLDQGLSSLYMLGLLVCFVLNATLVMVFITRIHRNLRERDARLAAARRRRVEEEHIVRMGLLASGAAHELGHATVHPGGHPGRLAARQTPAGRHCAAGRDCRNADAGAALQEHRQRHPAVGGRNPRRSIDPDHRVHLRGCAGPGMARHAVDAAFRLREPLRCRHPHGV